MLRSAHLLGVALLTALGPGCDEASASAEAPGARSRASATRQRGVVRGGERIARVVAWPAPSRRDEGLRGGLDPAEVDAIDRAPVPVLAPSGGWVLAKVMPIGEAGYTLVARSGAAKVVVSASRIAHLHRGLPATRPNARLRGVEGHVTVNEGIRSASWIEGGVAYTADLECGDPAAPECASAAGLVVLVDGLVYVGGAGAGAPGCAR